MTIRDLIEQLQEIERRGGERLDVVVQLVEDYNGFPCESSVLDVSEAFYAGGSIVELRT